MSCNLYNTYANPHMEQKGENRMKNIKKLMVQRDRILQQLLDVSLWVNGSIVETTKKVHGKESPFRYLSRSINGKNKITYVSERNLNAFKQAVAEGAKVKVLLAELVSVNVELIKAEGDND